MGKSVWDIIAPIAGTVLGSAVGMPMLGAAIGSGVEGGVKSGNPLVGLGNAVGSYAGGELGSSLLGPSLSGIGSSVNAISGGSAPGILGQSVSQAVGGGGLGNLAGNVFGSGTIGDIAGGAIGGSVGSDLGSSLGQSLNPMNSGGSPSPQGFSPSMQPQMGLPQSLSQFGSLTPQQQSSNIASRGVFGQGNGPEETNYFMNLMNRQAFDQSGNMQNNLNFVSPVDQSYLSQLGISGYKDPSSLLQGISNYKG